MNDKRSTVTGAAAVAATLIVPCAAFAAGPAEWQILWPDAASPTMERINNLNVILNLVILGIVLLVLGLTGYIVWRFRASRNPTPARWSHNTKLELAWTLIPVLILVAIAFPSFRLLYFMDRVEDADMTLKVTGHQWYWTYEYPDHGIQFDANMIWDEESLEGRPRLLATDNPVVLPAGVPIRIQLTSDDVIHSWALPHLGIKTDTVPGRLNETWVQIDEPGVYYGQCSELCGINHAYMPIEVRALPPEEFESWLQEARQEFAKEAPAPHEAQMAARAR